MMAKRRGNGEGLARLALGVALLFVGACGGEPSEPAGPVAVRPVPSPYTAAACIRSADCTEVMVAAHRGHYLSLPENSLAAIRAAAEIGVEVVEIDIRHTADDVLVLMHDGEVDRTTDGEGAVAEMTVQELLALSLRGGQAGDPESGQIPTFSEALALAKELGVMLYVDQKTDRSDLVREVIEKAGAFELVLIRANIAVSSDHLLAHPELIVMPHVKDVDEFTLTLEAIPELLIIETDSAALEPELYEAASVAGVKIQQDVFVADVAAIGGNYSAWKSYVDAGLFLLQTNLSHLLMPAVWAYRENGVFPESGPGAEY